MYEIVIVEACHYESGSAMYANVLEFKDDLWWFDQPEMTLEKAITPLSDAQKIALELDLGHRVEVVMICEAIRFKLRFCPNPDADHFDVSALHDECVHGGKARELFDEDMSMWAEIALRRLKDQTNPYHFVGLCNFYLLYEVETDEYRTEDGHLDDIRVSPTLVGELDRDKLNLALVEVQS